MLFFELFNNSELVCILEIKEKLRCELKNILGDFIEPAELEQFIDATECDALERVYQGMYDEQGTRYGEHEGIKFYIFESTTMIVDSTKTGVFRLCSPCYPNACDINTPETEVCGYLGYTLPADYFPEVEIEEQTKGGK